MHSEAAPTPKPFVLELQHAPATAAAVHVGSGGLLGRVLVACEYSGAVRDAFAALGWDAWSCDLLPSEKPGNHIVGDVREILADGWDILVAHPPCAASGRERRAVVGLQASKLTRSTSCGCYSPRPCRTSHSKIP